MQVDIGISEADRKSSADALTRLLADSYTLYRIVVSVPRRIPQLILLAAGFFW